MSLTKLNKDMTFVNILLFAYVYERKQHSDYHIVT
jgi:hypothetical protein